MLELGIENIWQKTNSKCIQKVYLVSDDGMTHRLIYKERQFYFCKKSLTFHNSIYL